MILITGASSGIGEACARALAQKKKSLLLIARRSDRLKSLARDLKAAGASEIETATLNVSDSDAVAKWAQANERLLTKVSVLVNNAGLARGIDPLQQGKIEDWDEMIDTNLKGLLYVTRAVLPHFVKANRGHIINMGSVAGRWVYKNGNVYCATKAAVKSLSESLRLDLLGTAIRVTEIVPGMVETEFSQVRLGDAEKAKAVYAGIHALGPEDIAEAVTWSMERPPHVNIQEIVIYPTQQASPTFIHRN